jgi:hypothetical protein
MHGMNNGAQHPTPNILDHRKTTLLISTSSFRMGSSFMARLKA